MTPAELLMTWGNFIASVRDTLRREELIEPDDELDHDQIVFMTSMYTYARVEGNLNPQDAEAFIVGILAGAILKAVLIEGGAKQRLETMAAMVKLSDRVRGRLDEPRMIEAQAQLDAFIARLARLRTKAAAWGVKL